MAKKYTAQEIIEALKREGFEYTVHGLRKQLDMGCVPSFNLEPHKKKWFTEEDLHYAKLVAYLRLVGVPLRTIQRLNYFLWGYEKYQEGRGLGTRYSDLREEYLVRHVHDFGEEILKIFMLIVFMTEHRLKGLKTLTNILMDFKPAIEKLSKGKDKKKKKK